MTWKNLFKLRKWVEYFLRFEIAKKLPDKAYLKMRYYAFMGKRLNLKSPKTFNEKLQWLKLYDRRPEYTVMVDKYAAKKYVSEIIGDEYIIPTLGAWDNTDGIDFSTLPDKFVIKCNHNSGKGMYICRDKSKMDSEKVREALKSGLAQDYFSCSREWPYKNVPRKIIAEQFIDNGSEKELNDYKFFCFNGEPKMILVCAERFSNGGLRENFYDTEWNLLPVQRPTHPNTKYEIEKPESLSKMIELSRILSKDIPFSRIDLYQVKDKIYFGEITFFPASGMEAFSPEEWDYTLGSWITLPEKK